VLYEFVGPDTLTVVLVADHSHRHGRMRLGEVVLWKMNLFTKDVLSVWKLWKKRNNGRVMKMAYNNLQVQCVPPLEIS
jgi:hypothetical protein